MYPDQVKANMAINNTSRKRILFNISIIEINLEWGIEDVNQYSFTSRYM